MLISFIIVNYKKPLLTVKCIDSIVKNIKSMSYEIIVVDNNSQDDSKQIIEKCKNIKYIGSANNVGFGAGNNIGVNVSSGKYLLLINPYVIIEDEKAITACLHKAEEDETIGVLGCKMLNEDRSVQSFTSTIARYGKILDRNLLFSKIIPPKKYKIEAIMGAFMFIPSKIMKECKGFDPDFFMYSEEIDLCNRIRKLGYKIVFLEDVSVIHKNGGSTPNRIWANKQSKLSTALLFYKVHGFFGYLLYHFIYVFNICTNFFLMWLLDNQYRKDFFKETKFYFSGFFKYISIPILYRRKIGKGKRQLKAK